MTVMSSLSLFALLGSMCVKAEQKMLVKLTPGARVLVWIDALQDSPAQIAALWSNADLRKANSDSF